MPSRLFFLDDQRLHLVNNTDDFKELCHLQTGQGPFLVIAKGSILAVNVQFNIQVQLRLTVISVTGAVVVVDETVFFTDPEGPTATGGIGFPDRGTFTLMVAATLPATGGAGSGPPPPPDRAVLSAMIGGGTTAAGAGISNVKIIVLTVDEFFPITLT